MKSSFALFLAAVVAGLPLLAQSAEAPAQTQRRGVQSGQRSPEDVLASIKTVDPAKVSQGWSVDRFRDTDAVGSDGEPMGEVEDLVFTLDGMLTDVVIEAGGVLGGLLDVGDTTFRVPWNQVKVVAGDKLQLPVTKSNARDKGILDRPETVQAGKGEVLASQLIRNNVYVPAARINGVVNDVIVGSDNRIVALIMDRDSLIDDAARDWPSYKAREGRIAGNKTVAVPLDAVDLKPDIPNAQTPQH